MKKKCCFFFLKIDLAIIHDKVIFKTKRLCLSYFVLNLIILYILMIMLIG